MQEKINIKDFALVSTSALPSEASETIIAAAIEQLKEITNLRQYGIVDKVEDEGAATYIYFTYDDLTAAYDRSEGADWKYDSAAATGESTSFLNISKGFQITWEAKSLSRLGILAAQSRAAVLEVKDREDAKIVTALASATSSVTAAGVWSGTSADPVKDVREAIKECKLLGYTPDVLLLEPVNYSELMSIIASNTWYATTEKAIAAGEVPTFMGLKIVQDNNSTHGTAYVFKSGTVNGAFQIGEAVSLRTHIFDDDDSHSTKVQIWERVAIVLVRPDAVASIATI